MAFKAKYRFDIGQEEGISLSQFYNENTLNIFSDGSYDNNKKFGAYGVVGICKDTILGTSVKASYGTSSSYEELKGLRLAISMANAMRGFENINIFCDNIYAIDAITKYIYSWYFDNKRQEYITGSRQVAKNQNLIYEIAIMLQQLAATKTRCQIIYQPGHVNNNYNELKEAANSFRRLNNVNCSIDLNFIRYISTWNNYIDNKAKSESRNMWKKLIGYSKDNRFCEDAISFNPKPMSSNTKY